MYMCVLKIGLTICLSVSGAASAHTHTHTDRHAFTVSGRQAPALLMFLFSVIFHSHKMRGRPQMVLKQSISL